MKLTFTTLPLLVLTAFFIGLSPVIAQQLSPVLVSVDLVAEQNGKVPVEITVPEDLRNRMGRRDVLTFHFPKTIPGTYTVLDYGRFIHDFTVRDAAGNAFEVTRVNNNSFEIKSSGRARIPHKITYNAQSTWTTTVDTNIVIEPAGTLYEAGHAYVINHGGLIGFFDQGESRTYEVRYNKPYKMHGATTLSALERSANTDHFIASDYHFLVDNPIMYCEPDTVKMTVGNVVVTVATCSRGSDIRSRFIANEISDILFAIEEYFGGVLPVDHYAFLVYISDELYLSKSYGALEHSFSSFYTLIDLPAETISEIMRRFVAHEFFHIITPLNIQSEEIMYFDYMNPQMSKHLWLYEGVTEYKAGHVQYTGNLIDLDEFLEWIADKMRAADRFRNDVPFTEVSKHCLDYHADQFHNFYNKGALIGMCLDLQLNILSDGEMNLMTLMDRLTDLYGPDRAFKDEELFEVIASLSYPDVEEFLKDHVAGIQPLPIESLLKQVGIAYSPESIVEEISVGFTPRDINYDGEYFFLARDEGLNDFGRVMGFEVGDIFKSWNHREVNIMTINEVFGSFVLSAKPGDALRVEVIRDGEVISLQGIVLPVMMEREHGLKLMEETTEKQDKLRAAWLRKS